MKKSTPKRTSQTTRDARDNHQQAVRDKYRANIKASSSSREEKLFSQDQPTHAFVAKVFFIFLRNVRRKTSVATVNAIAS